MRREFAVPGGVRHAAYAHARRFFFLACLAALSASLIYAAGFIPDSLAVVPPGERILDSSFEGTPPNLPPTLDAVGAKSVDLGSSLVINLSGSDPEAEPFFFGVFPSPDNASLDALSGEFIFSPDAGQVGLHEVTFTISDGIASDSELVEITINPAPPGGITMLSGRVLDTTDFFDGGTETGVVGATVSILGSGISTLTGADGSFVLDGIPAGDQIFDIDPAGVTGPEGSMYAGFREALHIIDNVDNQHLRPFFLPRIDMDSLTPVIPDQTTIVANPTLGTELIVDPNSAMMGGEEFAGSLSISLVPGSLAPAALPPELGFGMLITIQPVGVVFNTPAAITFPNVDNLPPGSEVDIWSLDPATGTFIIVGTGMVSADGSVIETISGGVRAADWHGPLPPGAEGDPEEAGCNCVKKCCKKKTGSNTSVSSGILSETHSLASYRSLSVNRSPTLVYNSHTADPRPLIISHPVIPLRAAIPNMFSSRLSIAGVDTGISLYTDTSGLSGILDETLRHVMQFDASALPSGRYPYQLALSSHYDMSTVGAFINDTVLVDNRVNSPFGAGWGFSGFNRLHEEFDKTMLLQEGDGSLFEFSPMFNGDGTFTATRSYAVGPNPLNVVTGDFNKDNHVDFATVNGFFSATISSPDSLDIFLNDGFGNHTLTRIELPNFPARVAAGDINSDTHVDFVITDGTKLRKVLADGVGGWLAPELIPRDAGDTNIQNALGIVLADFNTDTHLDIAFPNYNGNTSPNHIDVMLSNGPGTWDFAVQVEVGEDPQDLVSGLFNADAHVDLATPNSGTDDVTILLGDGNGGFTAATPLVPNLNPTDIEVADFDNDEISDLAVAHNGTVGQIVIFQGDGTGGFTEVAEFGQGVLASKVIAAGHFNADTNLDLVGLHENSRTVSVFAGNGTGQFPFNSQYNISLNNRFIAVADVTSDGQDDLVTSGGSTSVSNVSVLAGNGDGSLQDTNSRALTSNGTFFLAGDFDNDGDKDISVRVSSTYETHLADGNGNLVLAGNSFLCNTGSQGGVADFNGDGFQDIASSCGSGQDIQIGFGDGTGLFSHSNALDVKIRCGVGNTLCTPVNVTAGDFNLDGAQDLVVIKRLNSGPEFVQAIYGDGAGTFTNGPEQEIGEIPGRFRLKDLNHDNYPDVVVSDTFDKIKVLLNDGAGGILPPTSYAVGDEPIEFRFGDFNNDTHVDIASTATRTDDLTLLLGDGNGGFAVQAPYSLEDLLRGAENPADLVTGDFNGDGDHDVAVTVQSSHDVAILLGDGAAGFTRGNRYSTTARPRYLEALDLNNDGVTDLVTNNGNESMLSILIGNPSSTVLGYRSPPGEFSSLILNPDNSLTRRHTDGDEEHYDTAGLLTSVNDRHGNTASYDYDGFDRLVRITDPVGLETAFAYSTGRLSTITDPASRTTYFNHDGTGNLISILNPDGSGRSFSYDSHHNMVSQTSPRGFVTQYIFDSIGRNVKVTLPDETTNLISPADSVGYFDLESGVGTEFNPAPVVRPEDAVSVFTDGRSNDTIYSSGPFGASTSTTDPLLRTTTVTRNLHGDPVEVIDPDGSISRVNYDGRGNILMVTEAAGTAVERESRFTYDPIFNQVTSLTDFNGKVMKYEYDASGNLVKSTNPNGGVRNFTQNGMGLLTSVENENSHTTTFSYDVKGNVDSSTDPLTNIIDFSRDSAGNITSMTEGVGSPSERTRTWSYDALNRVQEHENGEGESTLFRYDLEGNPVELENGNGEILFITYDELSRPLEINDPLEGISNRTWDANNNVVQTVEESGSIATREYDAADQLTRLTDAALGEYVFGYDPNGRLVSLQDPNQNTATFDYDELGRQIDLVNPLNDTYTYTYDAMDNLQTSQDPVGQVLTNSYDDMGRLTQTTTVDNTIDYTYDAAGNVLSVDDDDSSLVFTYDALNQLLTAETVDVGVQAGTVITYGYDAVGNRISTTDTAGGVYGHTFDDAGRLASTSSAIAGITTLDYDLASRLSQVLYPNGTESNYTYDVLGRLERIEHSVTLGSTIQRFDYETNAVGNLQDIDDQSEGENIVYDALERVTGAGTATLPETYNYDALGNRISSHLSTSYTHDTANRLTEDDDFTFGYDDNGNLGSRTRKSNAALTTYTWDAQDQLVQIDLPDPATVTYRYDGLGRRTEKNVNGGIVRYVYDGEDILLEYDDADVLTARYGHGQLSDQPLFMERGGQAYYYHANHLGSVTAVTNSAGTLANQYKYDAYGRLLADTSESVLNPFSFTGREFDPESGLYYYRARYYDPEAGRFITPDPLGYAAQDGNLYSYVRSNPVNRLDPQGLLDDDVKKSIRKTPLELFLEALAKVASTLLENAVPKSKGPLFLGELGGKIGITIYEALIDSEELKGKLEVKSFHNSRNLKIRIAVRDVLRAKDKNCLSKLPPHIRKPLRDAAKDKRNEVMKKLKGLKDAFQDSINRGGDEGLREDLGNRIKKLQNEADFLTEAVEGNPVLGEVDEF